MTGKAISSEAEFVQEVTRFLTQAKPTFDSGLLTPGANLWEIGYLDSLSTVNLILFIEGMLGRELAIDGNAQKLRSIQSIYDHYVKPGQGPAVA